MEKRNLKFGMSTALALVLLTIITWGFGMIAIPPAGPYCPGNCMAYPYSDILLYYPRDYYWMYLAVFQVFTYFIFMVANHYMAQAEKKLYSSISAAFSCISSVALLLAYFVQFSVVPISMMSGETEGIALITQYNGHGIFIAMEELGYITMSISFLFLGFVFPFQGNLEKAIRIILLLAFILTLTSFVIYSVLYGLDRSYRFEVAAISINWLTTILVGILIFTRLRNQWKSLEKRVG